MSGHIHIHSCTNLPLWPSPHAHLHTRELSLNSCCFSVCFCTCTESLLAFRPPVTDSGHHLRIRLNNAQQPPHSDIYFALRTRGLPLECDPTSPKYLSFWSIFDCPNREVSSDPATLAITKLEVEVDTRWGDCEYTSSFVSVLPPTTPSVHLFVACALRELHDGDTAAEVQFCRRR
jgi:hypothetical protein